MTVAKAVCWSSLAFVAYSYCAYPLLIGLIGKFIRKPASGQPTLNDEGRTVSVIFTAFNEERTIERRLVELCNLLTAFPFPSEIILVSDGSTDKTGEIARRFADERVSIIELPENQGKSAALNAGCDAAKHAIFVFADSRQTWDANALAYLTEPFSDPSIGAVSGDLELKDSSGAMVGVGLYWRLEKWLRRQESLVHSTVGVSGSISAVRRNLFRCIPVGTILDDVYWPMRVVMQGFRVFHEKRAIAFDRLPESPRDEFRRKVRTLSGNFQLVALLPSLLSPIRNPIWFQFVSHKLCRLIVPWAMLALLVSSRVSEGLVYKIVFWGEIALVSLALGGFWKGVSKRLRLAGVASSFLVLNAAAWLAFWVWISGRSSRSWTKVAYGAPGPHSLETLNQTNLRNAP